VLKGILFQELHAVGGDIIQLIAFVCAFYVFKSHLFYGHCNREGDVIIIPSTMGTRQGDPWGRELFALTHFNVLRSIKNHFPSCLFPSVINNTHIISPPSILSLAYEHF
jgi:hypothetical protein